jgi:hypothetical protein
MLHGNFSSKMNGVSDDTTVVHEGSGYVLYFQAACVNASTRQDALQRMARRAGFRQES